MSIWRIKIHLTNYVSDKLLDGINSFGDIQTQNKAPKTCEFDRNG